MRPRSTHRACWRVLAATRSLRLHLLLHLRLCKRLQRLRFHHFLLLPAVGRLPRGLHLTQCAHC